MLTASRASETDASTCSVSGTAVDGGVRLFGMNRRAATAPDGAVVTFHEACRHHQVRQPNTELVEALLGTEPDARYDHLTDLRTLNCAFHYFGARHLMVLADFVKAVDGPLFAQQRLRFSLTPFLQELVLCNLELDFDIPEAAAFHLQKGRSAPFPPPVKVGANEAFRHLFTALEGHPSLQRLDLSNNAVGPALLAALQRLVKRTPSLVDVELSNCALSVSELEVVQATCQLNQRRLEQKETSAARERFDSEWQRQQEAWLRAQLQGSEAVGGRGPAPTSYVATVTGRPTLRYRLPKEDASLLSHACLDVVRAAFIEPAVASLTTLQGRPVPRGVPAPLSLPSSPKNAELTALLIEQVCASSLFRCLREHVLHHPTKPPSRYAHLGATFRSTKEDHYAHILATQDKQWRVVVGQLVRAMVRSTLSPGECLFRAGEEPYWVTFVARVQDPSVAGLCVEVGPDTPAELPATTYGSPKAKGGSAPSPHASSSPTPSLTYQVPGGQFVGEDDLLGAASHYVSDKYTVPLPTSRAVRSCTAHVRTPVTVSTPETRVADTLTVWQIPRDVAFFFLSTPFHALHKRAARVLKLFPSLQTLPSSLVSRVAYALQPVGITALELRDAQGNTASGPASGGDDPRLQADRAAMEANIYVLEEGEFYLGHSNAKGRWSEKSLGGGVVVMNATSLALDAVVRRGLEERAGGAGDHDTGGRGVRGEKLGKEAFERQYRETQRHQQQQQLGGLASSPHDTVSSAGSPLAAGASTSSAATEAALSLGGSSSHWKYYVVSNADFASLPQCVRLALTATHVSFDA